jgi:hypothetical protein
MAKESILQLLDLPPEFVGVLLLLSLILTLAPYLAGHDFGVLKIPSFSDSSKKRLRIIGPISLLLAEVGRAPGSPARIADIMAAQEGFETELGGFEVSQGIFTGTGEITHGFIFDLGNVNGGEIPRAHQPGQLHRVSAVGFHPVAGLFGNQRGGDDPADMAFLRQIALEPVPTGSRFIDQDQVWGFGLQLAHEVIFGDIGYSDGVFVDVQTDIERARLWHG